MIQFNELRVDSNKNLIIDASVLDITEDPNGYIHINHVYVGVGSDQEIVDLDLTGSYVTRKDDSTGYLRGIRIVLNLIDTTTRTILNIVDTSLDLTKQLFYVKVEVDTTDPLVPLSVCIDTSIEGYAYDKCLLLNKIFDYIKATDGTCDNLDNYANYIVKVNGLQLAVESGNFALASLYWNKFFANNSNVGLISNTGCGCRH